MAKTLTLNPVSTEPFTSGCGDPMPLDQFLAQCDTGDFVDADGFAKEVLLDKRIVADRRLLYPSELDAGSPLREQLLAAQAEHGPIEVVWYTK